MNLEGGVNRVDLSEEEAEKILDFLDFKNGLVTAVVRDCGDKEVLMVAFMNEQALMLTLSTGVMHYWSREREEIWKKGEESGNRQRVRRVRVDCDGDALLFDVDPEGPACHKGYRSCFYREIEECDLTEIMDREFDPQEVYGDN